MMSISRTFLCFLLSMVWGNTIAHKPTEALMPKILLRIDSVILNLFFKSKRYKMKILAASLLSVTWMALAPWSVLAGAVPRSKQTGMTSFAITSAQLSSAQKQKPGKLVEFELQDNVNGIAVSRNTVTIQKPGSYLLMAAPQITATKNGGCLDLWLVLNGKDIPNSSIRSCQSTAGNTDVLMSQTIIKLKPGDRIQVMTNGDGAVLDAVRPSKGPLIPSIIFTVVGLK